MSEPLIPVAPSLDEPLEILSACHGRIKAQLETLDRLVRWLPEHGADAEARKAAANVIRYFETAAVNHHRDEEEDLFPLLLARAAADGRMRLRTLIERTLDDHRAMAEAWAALRAPLDAIAAGTDAALGAEEVANFTARYLNHIDREDNELFPYAMQLLGTDDIEALSEKMKARRRVRR